MKMKLETAYHYPIKDTKRQIIEKALAEIMSQNIVVYMCNYSVIGNGTILLYSVIVKKEEQEWVSEEATI